MSEFDSEMIRIADIHPNPHRQLATYGLIESKVTELMASIEDTGFWPNVIGRRNADGEVEIAYGHHRLEACKRVYGPDHLLPVHIQNIDDHMMLQIMAAENSDDWANPQQHVRMCLRAAVNMLEAALKEYPTFDLIKDQSVREAFVDTDAFVKAKTESCTPAQVARWLGDAWTEQQPNTPHLAANNRVKRAWPLMEKTPLMLAGILKKSESKKQEATSAREKSKAPGVSRPQRAKLRKKAARAEEVAEQLDTDAEYSRLWDECAMEKFATAGYAAQFREAVLECEDGRAWLAENDGDWLVLIGELDAIIKTKDGKGFGRSAKYKALIADNAIKAKTQKGLKLLLDPTATADVERERSIAFELMSRLGDARSALLTASNKLNQATTFINENGMQQSASMHMLQLMTEISRMKSAIDRLERSATGTEEELKEIANSNVIEGDFYEQH